MAFEELKRYVRFSADDARLLAAIGPRLAPAFPRIAEEFYARAREHEESHAVFTSEAQIARLQSSLVVWLGRVLGGVYDEDYFAQTEQVARVHVRIGLPQRFVIMSMSAVRASLEREIVALLGDASEARPTTTALGKILDVELAVMLEVNRHDLLARVERTASMRTQADPAADVVDRAPLLFLQIDPGGNIVLFNRAAEKLTGWARDEVIGRPFVETMVADSFRSFFSGQLGRDGMAEGTLVTRSGKPLRLCWRFAAMGDSSTIAVGCDVTSEVATRDRLERESRLAGAGRLVAGLAHELRNPLNGAGLNLAVVVRALEHGAKDEVRDAARIANAELKRLGNVLTEFLDFARPRTLARTAVPAQSLCERAIARVRSAAESAHVRVASDLPSHELVLEADAESLEEVLVHLLENAIEALGPNGGDVIVRARREPNHVWIEVEDEGPGLIDANAPIFDPFYSTKPSGTGLGLAVAHRIVSAHDGQIDVESAPGCTRFRLRLPQRPQGMTT